MADFDFDELDKAVADVLSTDETPTDTPAVAPVVEAEASDTPAVAVEPEVASSETKASAPAARRSSGRFMDVVHPSSDMRGAKGGFTPPVSKPAVAPSATVSRTAPTLQPIATAPVVAATGTDSLDFEEDDWRKPQDSPFLPDAKVEKRPLGGTPVIEPEVDPAQLLEAPDEPLLPASTLPDPIDFAAHAATLPSLNEDTGVETQPIDAATEEAAEIEAAGDEAAEIEMNAEAIEQINEPESNFPDALPTPPEVAASETPAIEHDDVSSRNEPATKEEAPAGPASITQQYTEKPSSAEASGAIYDTEAYHAPVSATPKKKSGVWTFLWIFLLIVLGAGAGVAVYLYVLPSLGL